MKTEPTDEQLNIAVCKFRGWTNIQIIEASDDNPRLVKGNSPDGKLFAVLPNHITGIEALGHLHEAEKMMSAVQWNRYCQEIDGITRRDMARWFANWQELNPSRVIDVCLIHASARQRAIAMLSAVNQLPD